MISVGDKFNPYTGALTQSQGGGLHPEIPGIKTCLLAYIEGQKIKWSNSHEQQPWRVLLLFMAIWSSYIEGQQLNHQIDSNLWNKTSNLVGHFRMIMPMISHDFPMVGCPHLEAGRGSRYWHCGFHQLKPYLLHLRYQGSKPDAPGRRRDGSWEGHFDPWIFTWKAGNITILLKEGSWSQNYLASAQEKLGFFKVSASSFL